MLDTTKEILCATVASYVIQWI